MNEIFDLLLHPRLEDLFRDITTGVFVVDNGPQERPLNPLVQMCMARLLNTLKLDKLTQISFAEYHSKRNFVERVHAVENEALSKHGFYSSTLIHKNAHRENMEAMASEIAETLRTAKFGKKVLVCERGIKRDDFLFDDEEELTNFLSLSEDECMGSKERKDSLFVWGLDPNLEGDYVQDYNIVMNNNSDSTSWKVKYSTTLYSPISHRFELQRWIRCSEMHYMPWQEAELLQTGPWEEIPGIFIPSRILHLCFTCMPEPPSSISNLVIPGDVETYYTKAATLEADQEKERWKDHPLNKSVKNELLQQCRQLHIPVQASVGKTDLMKLICQKKGEPGPATSTQRLTLNIPTTISAINQLTVGKLRQFLHHYNLPIVGTKEQLALRVFLLRHGNIDAILEEEIEDLISIIKTPEKNTTRLFAHLKMYNLA